MWFAWFQMRWNSYKHVHTCPSHLLNASPSRLGKEFLQLLEIVTRNTNFQTVLEVKFHEGIWFFTWPKVTTKRCVLWNIEKHPWLNDEPQESLQKKWLLHLEKSVGEGNDECFLLKTRGMCFVGWQKKTSIFGVLRIGIMSDWLISLLPRQN